MTVKIDKTLCNGCGNAAETACNRICPGNLLIKQDGKAAIRDASLCWDCASCVKVCPRRAISLVLPAELGGSDVELQAEQTADGIRWRCRRGNAVLEEFFCTRKKINAY